MLFTQKYHMRLEDLSGHISDFTVGKSHILKDNIFMIQKNDIEQNMGVT